MKIFHVVTWNKSIVYFCSLQRNALLIYLPYFMNDLSKQFLVFEGTVAKMFSLPDGLEWVDVRDKWNFRAGCIEQIHCGYMYIRVRVPSKKKTWGMPGTETCFIFSIKWILDRIRWGAPFIIKKCIIYISRCLK